MGSIHTQTHTDTHTEVVMLIERSVSIDIVVVEIVDCV